MHIFSGEYTATDEVNGKYSTFTIIHRLPKPGADAQRDCVGSLWINLVWDGGIFVTAASAAGN